MKPLLPLILAASLTTSPVLAQDSPAPQDGAEAMAQGFRLLLEGLADEIEPLADDLADIWEGFLKDVDELPEYEPPEVLPNGDIIIRRKRNEDDADAAPEGVEL